MTSTDLRRAAAKIAVALSCTALAGCPDKTPPLPAGANACKWAVVEPLDCPAGGCIGFLFTMPATFATDPATDPRPPALCVTKTDTSPFNVNLDARKVVSGVCPRDADKLLDDFCK